MCVCVRARVHAGNVTPQAGEYNGTLNAAHTRSRPGGDCDLSTGGVLGVEEGQGVLRSHAQSLARGPWGWGEEGKCVAVAGRGGAVEVDFGEEDMVVGADDGSTVGAEDAVGIEVEDVSDIEVGAMWQA